jgi:hypothetical protein
MMRKSMLVLALAAGLAGLLMIGAAGAATKQAPVGSSAPTAGAAAGDEKYPPCGPYVSEGTSDICRFEQVYLVLEEEGFLDPCRFGSSNGACSGEGKDAPFPWGKSYNGENTRMRIVWRTDPSERAVTIAFSWGRQSGHDEVAWLSGHVPGAGSDRFTVTSAFAQYESNPDAGDHFFTPDLPGQGPGEVGGPLRFNFQNGSGTDIGAKLWVGGYLYLKH